MGLNLNQFKPTPRYDDKARLNGVELKVYEGIMKIVDSKRNYVKTITSLDEYKTYCQKYY